MFFPKLVPDWVCQTPIKILISQGLNERGKDETIEIDTYCNYQEKSKTIYNNQKKELTINGTIYISHDIEADPNKLQNGGKVIINGIERVIATAQKNSNLDGSVNFVSLEVI